MVGVINLKWRDSMAVAGWHFTQAEHDSGWPASMKPDQVAALQRPYIRGGTEHRPGRWQTEALMKSIVDACKNDTLPHDATVNHSPEFVNAGRIAFVKSWDEATSRRYVPAKEVTVYHITAPAFAAWLAAQREAPSEHIAAWIEASKSAYPDIEPPEGWTTISKYGTQLSPRHGKLARLEDVFDWLHSGGMSAHDAVYKIFGSYYEACIEGERCDLLILNATERPSDLARDGKTSTLPNVKFFVSAFPDLSHVQFEDGSFGGLVYSMGQAALRVWRGNADVSTDHYARVKDRKEAATDAKYGVQWPSDDALTKLLGRLAVPIKAANRFWHYGRVVNVSADTAQTEAVPLVATPVALTIEAIKGGAGKNRRGEWTDEAKDLMRGEWQTAIANGEPVAAVAKRFGFASHQAFLGVVKREKKGTRSGVTQTLELVTSAANRSATR